MTASRSAARPLAVFAYDFDGTLAPGNMQEHAFIPQELGMGHEDATGAALAVNYTSKTQYLFRINKWTLEEWDEVAINKALAKAERPVPFDRIAFFGDGLTDIPTMRLVTDQGGAAVAVYDPESPKSMAAARE